MHHTDATGSIDMAELAAQLRAAGCVWADEEAAVLTAAASSPAALRRMVAERCAGRPLEYVVGSARFCGLEVLVDEGVFIPRRRSEFLARCAVAIARTKSRGDSAGEVRALDLCCGTGAIALVLARRTPGVRLWASDVSPVATACAARNLAGTGCAVLTGDLFEPLAASGADRFDLIVANAPYVPAGDAATLPSEARDFEPPGAWNGGVDGLDLHRRVFAEAAGWLADDGCLLVETSRRQVERSVAIAEACGLRAYARHLSALDATVLVAGLR